MEQWRFILPSLICYHQNNYFKLYFHGGNCCCCSCYLNSSPTDELANRRCQVKCKPCMSRTCRYPQQAREQQPPPGTVRHTEKLGEDTYQHLYSPRPTKTEKTWGGGGKLPHKSKIWSLKAQHNLPERVSIIWNSAKTCM